MKLRINLNLILTCNIIISVIVINQAACSAATLFLFWSACLLFVCLLLFFIHPLLFFSCV